MTSEAVEKLVTSELVPSEATDSLLVLLATLVLASRLGGSTSTVVVFEVSGNLKKMEKKKFGEYRK